MNDPTLQSRIAAMSDTELRGHLLTCDGRGVKAKEAMLDELLRRQAQQQDDDCASWDGGRMV